MSILKIDLVSKLKDWFYTKSEVDSKLQSLSSDAVNVVLSLDKYNCKVGDTVTVTVTVTGSDGVGLSDYKVNLYCNGTSLSNGITNSTGVYSYSYTVTGKGVLVFNVGESNVQCLAKPVWSTIYSTSNIDLRSDGEHCEIYLHIPQRTYGAYITTTIETLNPDYSIYYNPRTLMIPLISHEVFAYLTYDHKLKIINYNSSSVDIPIYGVFQYILH